MDSLLADIVVISEMLCGDVFGIGGAVLVPGPVRTPHT